MRQSVIEDPEPSGPGGSLPGLWGLPAGSSTAAQPSDVDASMQSDRRAAVRDGWHGWPSIERASSNDVMQLASDTGSSPMQVGGILMLDTASSGFDAIAARGAIAQRIRTIPRLRQRLVRTPLGCGRPVWVDDATFDIQNHVRHLGCPTPGDDDALLGVAAEILTRPLPLGRPLWSATFVTGLTHNRTALIVVFHHVLADGIGGLAVLANLVDGAPTTPEPDFPRPGPSRRALFVDVVITRFRALAHVPSALRHLRGALAELRPSGAGHAPHCSLNHPTGPRRRFGIARSDLTRMREVAHAHGATVNDVVLTAVTGALHAVLRARGETLETFVVSVPVSARREDSTAKLGNQIGVIPVALPATGDPIERLEAVARVTRERKHAPRAASAALVEPVFRALAWLGVFHWFVDHQRLVTTFVTNLRGPEARLSLLGAAITDVIAVAHVTGNVTVAFAVLSYAGALTVTVIADPDACPDLPVVVRALQHELDILTQAEPETH